MKLHEYQAKRLFAAHDIPIPRGALIAKPAQARQIFAALGGGPCTLKVQIHAGGRGKAGGVLPVATAEQAEQTALDLLSRRCITVQTGPEGLPVSRLLMEERLNLARELYVAVMVDRASGRPVILASREGGMEIERLAVEQPGAIVRAVVDPAAGLLEFQQRALTEALGLTDALAKPAQALLGNLWRLCAAVDASLIEINPLIVTDDGRLLALDAKLTLDDNALFRHPELLRWRDTHQEHPLEVIAAKVGISYVWLEGNIGCLVNGAGLAMATNDIIQLHGGRPANFLDVGGGANTEQVTAAFKIILADKRVKAILVNIFGGIMKCDIIAQGLIEAMGRIHKRVPLVVRLEGTRVEEGRALLASSKLKIINATDLTDAAQKVVAAAA